MKNYSPYFFSFFRICFGIYLTVHFIQLIPAGRELFSTMGTLPDASLGFTYKVFPNILSLFSSPSSVSLFLVTAVIFSISFTLGIYRKISALVLWYLFACLFNRNLFISNPSIPYVGWMLLACALIPKGEASLRNTGSSELKDWRFPKILYFGALFLLGWGYSLSGFHKLSSPSWVDGSAIWHLINNPLSRDTFLRNWMIVLGTSLPVVYKIVTWGVLALELFSLPLLLWKKSRKWIWLVLVLMHLRIVSIVDFADLTFGMLLAHLFIFDAEWIPARKRKNKKDLIVFFDGSCGVCNAFVNFVIQEDKNKVFKFAPLQGSTAQKTIDNLNKESLNTIYLKNENSELFQKSTAFLEICTDLGGFWRILSYLKWTPKVFRDFIYDLFAKNRHRIIKTQNAACRIPTPEEMEVFLD